MKKKTLYLVALIFSISLFSAAKKVKGTCESGSVYCQSMKSKPATDTELNFQSLGLFLFNN